jgi:hypothetical protein
MREPAHARNCFVPVRVKSTVAAIRLQCAVRFSSRSLSDQRGVRRRLTKKNLEKCVTKFCEHPSQSLGCNARNAPGIVLSSASEIVKSWFVSENSVRDQIGRIGCRRSGKIYAKWGFFSILHLPTSPFRDRNGDIARSVNEPTLMPGE